MWGRGYYSPIVAKPIAVRRVSISTMDRIIEEREMDRRITSVINPDTNKKYLAIAVSGGYVELCPEGLDSSATPPAPQDADKALKDADRFLVEYLGD